MMFPVNVSPDMAMYNLLKSQGYEPAYAIAEFIDNALQAHLSLKAADSSITNPLEVDLYFYSNDFEGNKLKNSLVIKDNGPGIRKDKLIDAMKPAKTPSEKNLSEFGIGMKAAAVWFGDVWKLSTKPTDESVRYNLTFNLQSLINTHKDIVGVQEVPSSDSSGTTISLIGLRRPIDQSKYKAVCQDLRELYQRFTAGSDPELILNAHFNGTPTLLKFDVEHTVLEVPVYKVVSKKLYAIGSSVKWSVPISVVFQGITVTGFICLLEKGSYVANPGLIMFRYGRVIQGLSARPFLPNELFQTANKFERQRVYGELFADELPVTYTKDKFEIDEEAFSAQLRAVPGVLELLKQAQDYRVKETPIGVASESEIPDYKNTLSPAPALVPTQNTNPIAHPPTDGGTKTPTPPAPKPTSPPVVEPHLLTLLRKLKLRTTSLALQSIIEESIWQFQFKREIGTALCVRSVLELGVLDRVRRDFAGEYPKVSDKGIKALLNYMNTHLNDFFDQKTDHIIVKCVQSCANGTQPDVVLLNNVAHGHYKPNFPELNRFAVNLEALLLWAYS